MAKNSKDLEKVLKKYIDGESADDGNEELRKLLQQTSVADKYSLLMNVRGDKWWSNGNTGPQIAAMFNDLETMKCILEEFTIDQKYDVLKIQVGYAFSALYYAAENGNSSIITYLLTDLSQQQKYNLLQLQSDNGETPLHRAASKRKSEAVQAILTSLSLPLLLQLLNIKNNEDKTAADIRQEIYDELPVQTSQGIVMLHILQLKYFSL